jgi:hypothetical protein
MGSGAGDVIAVAATAALGERASDWKPLQPGANTRSVRGLSSNDRFRNRRPTEVQQDAPRSHGDREEAREPLISGHRRQRFAPRSSAARGPPGSSR